MKLHLPKQLFTALLAAITLAATPTAKGKEAFTNIDFTGSFYAKTYEFSFILNDGAVGGSVVGAYWGSSHSDGYGANALTIVSVVSNADGSYTYTLGLGRGALNDANIDLSTTFTPKSADEDAITFTGTFESGVVYTISGLDGGSGDKHASASITQMTSGSSIGAVDKEYYKNNMNGSASKNNGVNSAYSVAGSSLVWSGSGDSTAIAASSQVDGVDILSNWKTATLTGTASSLANANLIFDATSTVAKTVDISDSISVASIKVYDNYTFNATAATTLTTTSGLTVASGKTLTLEDNVTLSISSTIRGAGTLALEGGTLHIADCSTLDDLAYTFSDGTDGFRTGFSATLTEGTISTSADAFNITIEGGELTSYENGGLTATLNKEDIFYINTSRDYSAIKTSALGATGITVSSTGTLSIASSDTDWFVEGTFAAAVPVVPVSNAGNVVLDCSVTEGDAISVSLNSLFGDSAITQTSTGTTTISNANAVSTSENLSTSGTVKISGAESFANNEKTLTLDKLVLENVTEATINGADSGTGKVSGTIEVLGKSKLILTGNHDLLGWGTTASSGDYTDKILLRGTDAENKATLQLNTRQTCSTAIVMEGYSTILNGGNDADQDSAVDNNAGILQMHDGGSITATGTDNTFSAILYTYKATSIAVTNTGDTLLIDGVVHGSSQITKTGDGTLTFRGDMAWQRGAINVNDGIVVLDDAATLGSSAYVVASGAELQVSGVTRETFSNAVSGTGTLTKTGAGTLTMDGNLSVSNVKATGGTLKLTGTLGSGTYTATGGNITLGSMTVNSGVQLNLASTNGYYINAESGSVITNNGTIDLSGVYIAGGTRGDTAFDEQTTQFISLISSISGGNVKLHTGNFTFQLGNESGTGPAEVVFNAAYSNGGTLRLANYKKTTQWKVGSNASLTVSGQLWLDHKQELNIDGGQVSATSMKLGYDSGQYGSIINLSSGSLTTGTITLAGHKDTHKTAINMSGGELTFTNSATLSGEENSVNISITGGTLKATSSDWTLTGSDTHVVSLGNVAIDIAAGKTVTLAGAYDLTGTLTLTGNTTTVEEVTTTGTLALTGTMNVTDVELLKRDEASYTGGTNQGNGFHSGKYYLVSNTDGATLTTTDLNVTLGGAAVDAENVILTESGKHLQLITSSNGVFYVNDGEEAALDSTVASDGYTRHHVEKPGELTVAVGDTLTDGNAAAILSTTTGSGTIKLSSSVILSDSTVFEGDVEVTTGGELTIGGAKTSTVSVESFDKIILSGGSVKYNGNTSRINEVEVTTPNSEFNIGDTPDSNGDAATAVLTIDTLTVQQNATLSSVADYKHNLAIGNLTGAGTVNIKGSGGSEGKNQVGKLSSLLIESLSGFGGTLSIQSQESGTHRVYSATVNTGTDVIDMTNLSFTGFNGTGTATFNVQADTAVDTLSIATGTVNVSSDKRLTLGGGSIGTLNAATGTVALSSGAVLTLGDGVNASTHSIGTVTAEADSKINLTANATLNRISTGSVVLEGSGTYDFGDYDIKASTGSADTCESYNSAINVTYGTGWYGTVKFGSGSTFEFMNLDLNTFANGGNSTIELAGVTGYLQKSTDGTKTYEADFKLTGDGFTIKDGYGNSKYKFTGDFSGSGNLTVNKELTGGLQFTFAGDMSDWSGELKHMEDKENQYFYEAGDDVKDTSIGNKLTAAGSGESRVMNVAVKTNRDVVMNGELRAKNGATMNVTKENAGNLSVKSVAVEGTGVVNVAGLGISATKTDSATTETPASMTNGTLQYLKEEASFTIEDMTLVNTTITAATTTEVKLNNVTATNTMLAGGKNYTLNGLNAAEVSAPVVGTGGSDAQAATAGSNGSITYSTGLGVASGATLTLNLDVLGAVEQYGSGVYDITITLDGFGADYAFTQGSLAGLVKFDADSWLGKVVGNVAPEVSIADDQQVAALSENVSSAGTPSVSYTATPSVGTLVITISGLNVPEPTTSTLSLLALAALAARRRRK